MSRDEMRALQNEKFLKQVKHVYDNVPYYRRKMEEKGVRPEDIRASTTSASSPSSRRTTCAKPILMAFLRPRWSAACASSRRRARRASASSPLHAGRHRHLGGMLCARHRRRGRRQEGRRAGELRLRPVYGRARAQRRLPQGGLPHHPHLFGQHRPTDPIHDRPAGDLPLLHPLLRHVPCRVHRRKGPARSDQAARGHLRAEAWTQERAAARKKLGIRRMISTVSRRSPPRRLL